MKHILLFETFSETNYSSFQKRTIDELLDKMVANGIDSLTQPELDTLKNADQIEDKNDKSNTKAFNFNKVYSDTTGGLVFNLTSVEYSDIEVFYYGTLNFKHISEDKSVYDIKYRGYVYKDLETESVEYSFVDLNDEQFDPSEYDLHYEFDDLIQQVAYDDEIIDLL